MSGKETPRDKDVLDHILAFEFCHGRLPTTKELCFYLRMTHGQLARHLARLADNGKLMRLPPGIIPYVPFDPTKQFAEPFPVPDEVGKFGEVA